MIAEADAARPATSQPAHRGRRGWLSGRLPDRVGRVVVEVSGTLGS